VSGGVAVLAVRAFSFAFDGGLIGPAHRMFLRPADGTAADNLRLDGEWKAQREHDMGIVMPPAAPMGPSNPNTPHILFDSMVAPLVPYAIRGAIWYQGESNEGNAADYRYLQVAMVEDWRRAWGQGDFPFCAVALASFRHPSPFDERSNWARLREAQLEATRSPGIGLASALDLGDTIDIHPRNKRDVGFRLAQWALAETYGFPVPAMGPRFVGYALETGAVRARFDHVGSGLVARGGELATFHVAGLDRVFRPAAARIEGNSVVASSPDVPQPVALRYAWADNPEGCNLYNAEGLPASPFRTDDW
jgi:sialate O-acetylesterase